MLKKDIRDDDAEAIVNAIMMVKGVAKVVPIVSEAGQAIAEMREREKLRELLYKVIHELE